MQAQEAIPGKFECGMEGMKRIDHNFFIVIVVNFPDSMFKFAVQFFEEI